MALTDDRRLRRFWHSRSSFIAAAILIGLTVVAVVLLIVGGGAGPTPIQAPAAGGMFAPPPTPTDHDLTIPTIGPIVTWNTFGNMFVPDGGRKYGPTWQDGPAVGGFAHSPRGAVVALANVSVRGMLAGDDWRKVVDAEIAPGPGRDVWRQMRATLHGPVSIPDPMQFAGFKFVTYSSDLAVINVATQAANGDLQMTTETMVWQGGDWKLMLQADGSDSPTQTPLTSLDSFAPWGGAGWR